MLQPILRKIFGTQNDRTIKLLLPIVQKINDLEKQVQPLSDDDLKAQTAKFKERLDKGESLDDLMPEAFATAREAAKRILGERAYDVQLIGGITLHSGRIAEMKTGEGKTLTSVLPVYTNALSGKGVHVVTVNDYLAQRDAEWMGQVHRFLGLDVGAVLHGMSDQERKDSYGRDITYGQNNEFGFDYLRDNMKFNLDDYVQRKHNYAIVDEVDSILIDEARTPLIISGPSEGDTRIYYDINALIPNLKNDTHFTIEEKSKSAVLTDEGVNMMESLLKVENLYDPQHIETVHAINQALRAHNLYKPDVDYVVREGEVVIVDDFTGRLMPGRRWSDGLHQAIEAKEGVTIENENQTLATITFQNYFRMYEKLAGMTGTADTEATEFKQIYNLDVTVVPTNKPIARVDHADVVYKSYQAKVKAMAEDIKDCHDRGQPVLVGTVSIEKSEDLAAHLKRLKLPHNILNAKQHEKEATIVANAGRSGAITIATNMAGRGTDIKLGGNVKFLADEEAAKKGVDLDDESAMAPLTSKYQEQVSAEQAKVLEAGGLHIIGTERHESRRIDNQLRGRSGRQGDKGSSKFYLSLEDDLMRIFGAERIQKFMDTFGMEDDEPIEHNMVSRAIENAQKKVEGHNYDIRKHLLQYDDVMNQQRGVVYSLRKKVLEGKETKVLISEMVEELSEEIALQFWQQRGQITDWDWHGINENIRMTFNTQTNFNGSELNTHKLDEFVELVANVGRTAFKEKEKSIGEELMRDLEKVVFLQIIDTQWKDHLLSMDHLKEGIGLRGYGQKDPLLEYKKEGFELFERMKYQIKFGTISRILELQLASEDDLRRQEEEFEAQMSDDIEFKHDEAPESSGSQPSLPLSNRAQAQIDALRAKQSQSQQQMQAVHNQATQEEGKTATITRDGDKIGRNDPCPCGSGKKYKKCHGK